MKPYIICHMMSSVDGRIDCDMTEKIGGDEYYEVLKRLDCSSELSGRVTMQKHFAMPELFMPADVEPVGRESFYEAESSRGYSKPLLVFTSEQAPKEYFEALHRQNISWIAAGKEHVDLSRAVEILNKQFGVDRLAVVGGGNINGAFLREGLIDEVSIVVGAGIDGRRDMTAVFDGIDDPSFPTTILRLIGVERVGENSVWLRYAFR